ncbi:UNVERIFIED_ORG: hypothetical protein E4P37_16795 [Bacillus sp. AZ43]
MAAGPATEVPAADGRAPGLLAGPVETAAEELGAREAFPRLLKVFGAVLAQTSLLTGLLFYFGRSRSAGYYRYFRVNFTVLDLTTNDFLFAGIDGLFVPIAVACLLALLLLWLNRLLLTRVPEHARSRAVRVLVPLAAVTGVVLVGLAFLDLVAEGGVFGANSPIGGLCLAVGVIALVYAVRLVRLFLPPVTGPDGRPTATTGLAEWGAAFLLVTIGLFWAADGYAYGVGTRGAITLHRALPDVPEAVLYSAQSLSLGADGVTERRCGDPEAAYRFRYDGLRLVRQTGDQYVLLPATWTREDGTALLIARGEGVRLEFRAPAPGDRAC